MPAVNIPYVEMLELGDKEEMLDSVVAYVERDLADQLPSDLPILAVCAKGDTSEFVAQALRRLGYASANRKGGMKAWGEHYATRALVEGPDLAIYQVSRPARGCLSYLVASAGKAISDRSPPSPPSLPRLGSRCWPNVVAGSTSMG